MNLAIGSTHQKTSRSIDILKTRANMKEKTKPPSFRVTYGGAFVDFIDLLKRMFGAFCSCGTSLSSRALLRFSCLDCSGCFLVGGRTLRWLELLLLLLQVAQA